MSDEPPARGRWYGWQTLLVDAGAVALLAASNRNESVQKAGVTLYALGPMIVHIAHGRAGIGLADLGIRLGAPVLLGLTFGAALGAGDSHSDSIAVGQVLGFVVGATVGYAAAVAIDAAALAREPAPRKVAGLQWGPTIAPRKGGATLGLVGAF